MSRTNNENYEIEVAIDKIKKESKVKFDETLDFGCELNIDSSKSDNNVRGSIEMPHGTGKNVSVAVFCDDKDVCKALKEAGADYVGDQDLVEQFRAGKVNCDVCLASPSAMIIASKISKILGPRGLMPNPKSGTVSDDLVSLVQSFKKGQIVYKMDSCSNLYAGIGKLSFDNKNLIDNIMVLFKDIFGKLPKSSNKSVYIKKVFLSSTMGQGSCVLDKKALILNLGESK